MSSLIEDAEVVSSLDEPVDKGENGIRLFFEDGRGAVIKQVPADRAQDLLEILVVDDLAAEGDRLIEKALGVAEAPFGGVGDEAEPGRADRDVLLFGDVHQVVDDLLVARSS